MTFIKRIFQIILLLLPLLGLSNRWELEKFTMNNLNGTIYLQVQSLSLPYVSAKIADINYNCKDSYTVYPIHQCKKGSVTFNYENVYYDLLVSGWFDFQKNSWQMTFENKAETIEITTHSTSKNELKIQLKKMKIIQLEELIRQYADGSFSPSNGQVSADIQLVFKDKLQVNIDYLIEDLSWESSDESFIFADTTHSGSLELEQTSGGFDLSIKNLLSTGEGLLKDIYILFDDYPIDSVSQIKLNESFNPKEIQVLLTALKSISFDIKLDNGFDYNPVVNYKIDDLNKFYQGFLSTYVEINGIEDLSVSGQSKGRLIFENSQITQAAIEFEKLNMQIPSKKIKFDNFATKINWHNQGEWQSSIMRWDGLLLAGMPVKKSEFTMDTVGGQLKLKQNTHLPIFDGTIIINELLLQKLFSPQVSIDFNGEVTPISIALITEKMGWPIMNGSISGKIPGMRKKGQSITFDGFLDLNVFDGDMQISDLSIERLFGVAPVIAADIKFQNLDLQQITSTFDFGEITGLIEGYVRGLRITNWKADRLDAYIQSVKSKGIKQTISQKAIDNISSIGGIQGALSRSFLRFFDYFNYKMLGIGCKLRNAICEMSGLKTDNDAYQLIQGKGLPSINIMGYKRYIDWGVFLDRLLNAGY